MEKSFTCNILPRVAWRMEKACMYKCQLYWTDTTFLSLVICCKNKIYKGERTTLKYWDGWKGFVWELLGLSRSSRKGQESLWSQLHGLRQPLLYKHCDWSLLQLGLSYPFSSQSLAAVFSESWPHPKNSKCGRVWLIVSWWAWLPYLGFLHAS